MPAVTLTFNLPEERKDFDLATHAFALRSVLSELDNLLRNKIKYSDPGKNNVKPGLQYARDELRKLINDYELHNLIFEE